MRPRASVEREDARRTHRERERLIAERVQHVNRIKGLLATQGIYEFLPRRRDRRVRLDELRTGDGRALPPRLRQEIEREFGRLELVLEQVGAVEAERDAAVAAPAADDADVAKVAMLARLGGIGNELATVLVREALYRPFANRKEVAACAGLTPSPFTSGDRHQGISKAGNPLLRKSMVELAWLWLRYQPSSALARWFTERIGEIRGRIRKITAVALAGNSTGFVKPSPKMGPTAPSRPAPNEATGGNPRFPPDTSDAAGLRCLCPAYPRPPDENGDAACLVASYESRSGLVSDQVQRLRSVSACHHSSPRKGSNAARADESDPHDGAMAECPSCRSAGPWSVIPIVGSRRKPCCAMILIGRPNRSYVGLSSAGGWK
ncbi:transposase [Sabulicella rubraurantiaca]|uniref:transposase n=1 Tax=Sabulicella rubraurantiaca TaxID=2811429 RepID=UPI001A96CCF3|nr:transposase [Sabulicella rubraurantiaca]